MSFESVKSKKTEKLSPIHYNRDQYFMYMKTYAEQEHC